MPATETPTAFSLNDILRELGNAGRIASRLPATEPAALLTLADVARIVGFTERWLRELRQAGLMPPPAPVNIGKKHGHLRWHPAVIDAWLRGEWQPTGARNGPETPAEIQSFAAGPAAPRKRPGPRRKAA